MYQSLQGNLGLGKAIEYFTSINATVSIPLNDTQPYDLIVDIDDKLYRVSVKTSRQTKNGVSYAVQLRNTGGGRANNIRQVNFDNTTCDLIFIYTIDENMYLVPAKEVSVVNSITVSPENLYAKYLVKIKSFKDFIINAE